MTIGILLIIEGSFALFAAVLTKLISVIFLGTLLLVVGVLEIISAFRVRQTGHFWVPLSGGVLALVVGALFLYWPLATLASLTLLIAGYLFASGLFRGITSIMDRYPRSGWDLAYGILAVVLGVIVVRQWPFSSLWVLGVVVAAEIIPRGITLAAAAWALRDIEHGGMSGDHARKSLHADLVSGGSRMDARRERDRRPGAERVVTDASRIARSRGVLLTVALGASVALLASARPARAAPDSFPAPPGYGWNVYSQQAFSAVHREALRTRRPTLIRWLVEWDKFHYEQVRGIVPPPPSWDRPEEVSFFRALRAGPDKPETFLVVQLLVSRTEWWAAGAPNPDPAWLLKGLHPGVVWAKETPWTPYGQLWPHDLAASYGAFVSSLHAALTAAGVRHVFAAWNEPELRANRPPGDPERTAGIDPDWVRSGLLDPRPTFGWSGGAKAKWAALHATLGEAAGWTSSGVRDPSWARWTGALEQVTVFDLHAYGGGQLGDGTDGGAVVGDIEGLCVGILADLDRFPDGTPNPRVRPFFIGENDSFGGGRAGTNTYREAARQFWRHQRLIRASEGQSPGHPMLVGRYGGFLTHANPAPWTFPADDPRGHWWVYPAAGGPALVDGMTARELYERYRPDDLAGWVPRHVPTP